MLPSGAGFAQPQVAIVRDLSDSKGGSVQSARNHTSRAPAAFAQHKIAERVAFPAGHGLHDGVSCEVLATWRSVEIDPTGEGHRDVRRSTNSIFKINNLSRQLRSQRQQQ